LPLANRGPAAPRSAAPRKQGKAVIGTISECRKNEAGAFGRESRHPTP
jgi:hypothetical protein